MTDDVKERVARAISSEGIHAAFRRNSDSSQAIQAWRAIGAIPDYDWNQITFAISWEAADAALAALRPGDEIGRGLIVVPKLPTEAMIRAWVGAGNGTEVSAALRVGAMRDWGAMLAAAKEG